MKHLKEEFDKLSIKEVIVYSLAIMSTIAGFTLLFMGMLIPPEGQIHESVLTVFGLVLIFVGSLLGISMHYKNELARIQATIPEMIATAINPEKTPQR